MGSDVRCVGTTFEGRGKTIYEKVFCARGGAENVIKDMNRLTRFLIRQDGGSLWEAQFRPDTRSGEGAITTRGQ